MGLAGGTLSGSGLLDLARLFRVVTFLTRWSLGVVAYLGDSFSLGRNSLVILAGGICCVQSDDISGWCSVAQGWLCCDSGETTGS